MQFRHKAEYAATAFMLGLCRRLPERAVFALFRSFGRAMFHLLKSRTRLTLKNLEIAFPEKSATERRKLARDCYLSFCDSMAFNTLMMSGRISNERLNAVVETEGWELVEQAEAQSKKGIMVVTAHIGNWELLPQYAALHTNRKLNAVARKTTNPLLEEKIVRPLRERFGLGIFYKEKALMRIMKSVNRGEHAGILIDQKQNPPEGTIVEMFGRPAPATRSSALLQIRFGITVLPVFMVKTPDHKYRMIIKEPVQWEDNGKSMEEQVDELTQIHQKIIEEVIREYPEQWFWQHNRWGLKKGEY